MMQLYSAQLNAASPRLTSPASPCVAARRREAHAAPSAHRMGSCCGMSSTQADLPIVIGSGRLSALHRQQRQQRQYASSTVARAGRVAPGDHWWERDTAPNMKDIHGTQELLDALAEAGDRLVIIDFYAQWCNACRALFPKLCKLMAENVDSVVFLKVDFDENRDMARSMGVKVLPYFHFYRGAEGRVDAFSCTVSKLPKFKEALENYSTPFCSLEQLTSLPELPGFVGKPSLEQQQRWAQLAAQEKLEDEQDLHELADTPSVVSA